MKKLTFVTGALGTSLALLGGCDGKSSGAMNNPPPRGDSFVVAVQTVTATSPDSIEPDDIATVVATTPEDKEPDPIT